MRADVGVEVAAAARGFAALLLDASAVLPSETMMMISTDLVRRSYGCPTCRMKAQGETRAEVGVVSRVQLQACVCVRVESGPVRAKKSDSCQSAEVRKSALEITEK